MVGCLIEQPVGPVDFHKRHEFQNSLIDSFFFLSMDDWSFLKIMQNGGTYCHFLRTVRIELTNDIF